MTIIDDIRAEMEWAFGMKTHAEAVEKELEDYVKTHGKAGSSHLYDAVEWNRWDSNLFEVLPTVQKLYEHAKQIEDENTRLKHWMVYLLDDTREVDWMCMSEAMKTDAVHLLGEENTEFKYYTDRLKHWADWQRKRGKL